MEATSDLKEEESYKFLNATVRSFNGTNYISLGEKVKYRKSRTLAMWWIKVCLMAAGNLRYLRHK